MQRAEEEARLYTRDIADDTLNDPNPFLRVSRNKLRAAGAAIFVLFLSTVVLAAILVFEKTKTDDVVTGFGVAKHAVLIGLDGFGGRYWNESIHPIMDRMRAKGTSTIYARNNVPCESKPNWASILTGATPEENGMESNYWYPERCEHYGIPDPECLACRVCHEIVSDLRSTMGNLSPESLIANRSEIIAKVKPRCVELHYWNYLCENHTDIAFDYLVDNRADQSDICITKMVPQMNWPPYSPCRPLLTSLVGGRSVAYPSMFGHAKKWSSSMKTMLYCDWDSIFSMVEDNIIDDHLFTNNTEAIVQHFEKTFSQTLPSLSFLYFGDIDEAGHEYGWGSPEYLEMITAVDAKVGRVLDTIEKAKVSDNTVIIVISDHGGGRGDYDHGVITDDDNLFVPFILNGPRVMSGHITNRLVRVIDVAPTLLMSIGIPSERYQDTVSGRHLAEYFY